MTTPQMYEKIKARYNEGQGKRKVDCLSSRMVFFDSKDKDTTLLNTAPIYDFIFGDYQFLKTMWPIGIVCKTCKLLKKYPQQLICDDCNESRNKPYEYHARELGGMCARECSTGKLIKYIADHI